MYFDNSDSLCRFLLQWGLSLAAEDMWAMATKAVYGFVLQWGLSLAAEDICADGTLSPSLICFNGASALRLRIWGAMTNSGVTVLASMGPQPCG